MFSSRICILFVIFICFSTFVRGAENITNSDTDDKLLDEGIFGAYLINWTISSEHNNRETRVMQLPMTQGGFVASNNDLSENSRIPGKIVNRPGNNNVLQAQASTTNTIPSREVSETDLYLLSAMEKLVLKMDFMEKRVKKLEEMLYHVVAGNKIDREPCPSNFIYASNTCYYIGMTKNDWQAAYELCKEMGAKLMELESNNEKNAIAQQLLATSQLKGRGFWTGGLNPGLLWIWSSTAKPILNKADSKVKEIFGNGRCLGLVYERSSGKYIYRGQNCSTTQYYICESQDNTYKYISRLGKQLGYL